MRVPGNLLDLMRASASTASITVVYQPPPDRLLAQLQAIMPQVDLCKLVNNGDAKVLDDIVSRVPDSGAIRVLHLGANLGVAAALNRGLEVAVRAGVEWALLLDQDSIPGERFVASLLGEALEQKQNSAPIAAIGPRIVMPRDGTDLPFIRLGWLRNQHLRGAPGSTVDCDFLITSGCLVRLDAFARIGGFDEGLFIDSVDLEWSFRAKSLGYRLLGSFGTVLDHEIGASSTMVAGVLRVVIHPPVRLYFMTRNRILLYRRDYVPAKWKLKDSCRMVMKFFAMTLFVAPRLEYAKMSWKGFLDGVFERAGTIEKMNKTSPKRNPDHWKN